MADHKEELKNCLHCLYSIKAEDRKKKVVKYRCTLQNNKTIIQNELIEITESYYKENIPENVLESCPLDLFEKSE